MKQFLTLIEKEFLHIFRDRWSTIILLILPVLLLFLFGYMMNTEVKGIHFVVHDAAGSVEAQQIAERAAATELFIFEGFANSPQEIESLFLNGTIKVAILFRKDAIELIADSSDPNSASTAISYLNAIIYDFYGAPTPPIEVESKLLYNPSLKSSYYFVPGVMGMVLMLICAIMASVSIAREKERGNIEMLLVSPLKPLRLIISKMIPYFAIAVINLATILIISYFVMEVPIRGSFALFLLFSFIFITTSLSMGVLISAVVKSQMVALLISAMVLMLPATLLSGMVFPIDNMPFVLRWVSYFTPATWYISGIKKIMLQGVGLKAIAKELAILASMAVVLIGSSLLSFNKRVV
ncbi:MAG: ABC transporter permease [Bacteroidales bacterium]